jgi:membrane-associated phospholipid phosphatase
MRIHPLPADTAGADVPVRNWLRRNDMTRERDAEQRVDAGGARRRTLGLAAVAAAAGAGFGVLAAAAARRDTAAVDEELRRRTAAPDGHPARRAAEALAPAGKWYTYVPAALGACAWLLAARGPDGERRTCARLPGAGAVLLAGTVATALNPAFDRWLPQPPAPPGHRSRRKPVFPSGHAFGPGAVSFAAAYVGVREGLAHPGVALPAALALPLMTAGGRVLLEKHWASDVLGGYLGALTVAAASLTAYEAAGGAERDRQDPRIPDFLSEARGCTGNIH